MRSFSDLYRWSLAASLAYDAELKPGVKDNFCETSLPFQIEIADHPMFKTRAVVARYTGVVHPSVIWVSIRGTSEIQNTIEDLKVGRNYDRLTDVNFHSGFMNMAKSLVQQISKIVGTSLSCTPMIFIGHSSGGAVATILAAWFHMAGYTVREIITFGCPKLTDWPGCKDLSKLPVLRVNNTEDPLPFLPPWMPFPIAQIFRPYRPFGKELLLDGNTGVFSDAKRSADFNANELYKLVLSGKMRIANIEEHHISTYSARLKRLMDEGGNENWLW